MDIKTLFEKDEIDLIEDIAPHLIIPINNDVEFDNEFEDVSLIGSAVESKKIDNC